MKKDNLTQKQLCDYLIEVFDNLKEELPEDELIRLILKLLEKVKELNSSDYRKLINNIRGLKSFLFDKNEEK